MRVYALNEREAAICRRLRIWREANGWSRASVAKRAQISPEGLAHIESGRVPLRYEHACKISQTHTINPYWLADGVGEMTGHVRLASWAALDVSPRDLFSEVYDTTIGKDVSPEMLQERPMRVTFSEGGKGRESARAHIGLEVDKWLDQIPDSRLNEFVEMLTLYGDKLTADTEPSRAEVIATRLERTGGKPTPEEEGILNRARKKGDKNKVIKLTIATEDRSNVANEIPRSMSSTKISDRLKAALAKSNLTHEGASEKWGINRRTIEDWAQGRSEPRGLYREKLEKILRKIEAA